MQTPSFEAKKAYCIRTRQANYQASLRLEGLEPARNQQPEPPIDETGDRQRITKATKV